MVILVDINTDLSPYKTISAELSRYFSERGDAVAKASKETHVVSVRNVLF